jgi:hypothetical protein
MEALKAYTINAAYAAFEEQIKGSIKKGKLADFIVLSRDIFKLKPPEILKIKILRTVVGGKIVFMRKSKK